MSIEDKIKEQAGIDQLVKQAVEKPWFEVEITKVNIVKQHPDYFAAFIQVLGKDQAGNEYIMTPTWMPYKRFEKLSDIHKIKLSSAVLDQLTPKVRKEVPKIEGMTATLTYEQTP